LDIQQFGHIHARQVKLAGFFSHLASCFTLLVLPCGRSGLRPLFFRC
jgi:hypothetical protein